MPRKAQAQAQTQTQTQAQTYELRLSGSGGQGLLLAGVVLAEAGMRDGLHVVQTQSYGPEARLGASRSEVILSSEVIAYPKVTHPDLLLCLSQDAFDKYYLLMRDMRDGAQVIVDNDLVELPDEVRGNPAQVRAYPIIRTAKEVGHVIVANVVALGLIQALTGWVSARSLREAVSARVPARFLRLNLKALEAGQALALGRSSADRHAVRKANQI